MGFPLSPGLKCGGAVPSLWGAGAEERQPGLGYGVVSRQLAQPHRACGRQGGH